MFEEVLTDNVENLIQHFSSFEVKGELVVMLHRVQIVDSVTDYDSQIKKLKDKNFSDKDISIIMSTLYGINKNDVYKYLLK